MPVIWKWLFRKMHEILLSTVDMSSLISKLLAYILKLRTDNLNLNTSLYINVNANQVQDLIDLEMTILNNTCIAIYSRSYA